MKMAIELISILIAGNIALALQLIYVAQKREQHEQFTFDAGPHPPVVERAGLTGASPASVQVGATHSASPRSLSVSAITQTNPATAARIIRSPISASNMGAS